MTTEVIMKVLDVMNKSVVTCHPMEKVTTILNKFELFHIAGMPVAEKGHLVGIICQTDILRAARSGSLADFLVKDVMKTDVITVSPTESAVKAARIMIDERINRIPVTENDRIVGIITRGDLIRAVALCE